MIDFINSDLFAGIALLLALWSLPWKGYALWLAARNKHQYWFIALLLVNSAAILEIIYIFAIGRKAIKKLNTAV